MYVYKLKDKNGLWKKITNLSNQQTHYFFFFCRQGVSHTYLQSIRVNQNLLKHFYFYGLKLELIKAINTVYNKDIQYNK